jgi:hypothetical protein
MLTFTDVTLNTDAPAAADDSGDHSLGAIESAMAFESMYLARGKD